MTANNLAAAARSVALHVVVVADPVFAFGQDFLHFPQMLLRLGSQRVIRILLKENLELILGGYGMASVAIRLVHLSVVRHSHLHLGIGGFRQERKEHDQSLCTRRSPAPDSDVPPSL